MEMLRPCLLGGVAGAVIFREMNGHIEMLGADTVFHVMVAVAFLVTLDRTTTVTDSDE